MDPERWDKIAKILEVALETPTQQRETFLRQACVGDIELERELQKLLAADKRATSFLEASPINASQLEVCPALQSSNLKPGTVISGRFKIVRLLGQGGMGVVYESIDTELNARVALKTLRKEISSDPAILLKFKREVALTRRITHPNVCRTFDLERHAILEPDGSSTEMTFLTMELLEGETLSTFLKRRKRLTPLESLPLITQMISALSAAHSKGIVHCDFKPANVLLVPNGDTTRLVVTDFGLARVLFNEYLGSTDSILTTFSEVNGFMGTPAYMAPEQLEFGKTTFSSDIYSLGLVVYEMITGVRPHADSNPLAIAIRRITKPIPAASTFVPELDRRWDLGISKCLELSPDNRFKSVDELLHCISGQSSALPLADPQPKSDWKTPYKYRKFLRVRPIKRILLSVLVLVAIFVSLNFKFYRHYQRTAESKLLPGTTVLMTEFRNNTEDKRFDTTTELVRHQLTQSPFFTIVEPTRIRDSLEEMRKSPDAPLTPDIAREVALRTGAVRIVFGAINRVGDSYALDLEIERPDNDPRRTRSTWNNHLMWNIATTPSGPEIPHDFLNVVREASNWIRTEMGESANDITRNDVPPEDVTTGDWRALSEFVNAEQFKSEGRSEDAIVALHNAVASDPHFALAFTRLGDLLISLGRFNEGYEAYREAQSEGSKYRLTRREKDRLQGIYASDTENFVLADSMFRDYAAYYPNDYLGWFYRAYPLMMLGKPEEAITSLTRAAAIDPNKMFAPAHLARFDLVIGNYADASKWIRQLRNHAHEDDALLVEGELYFLQNHHQEALASFTKLESSKDPHYHSYSFSLRARVYAEMGEYRNALEALKVGSEEDLKSGQLAQRANKLFDIAYIELKIHRFADCLESTRHALELDRSFQATLAAVTLMGSAATESSGPLKREISIALHDVEMKASREELKPLSEIVRFRMRAEVHMSAEEWAEAIDQFGKASDLEPPARDRGRLIQALTLAVRHSKDPKDLRHLCGRITSTLDAHRIRQGQVWQWSMDYPPGYFSDQAFGEIRAISECKLPDSAFRSQLMGYLELRRNADANIPDVDEAKAIATSLRLLNTNSNTGGN